ncbi:MFS transporter [Reticulibacter mediterranei]|uniref:MFS transporter n=1 Tax=Reticulibacter mediterranei TaxID=2778369 RepID=A0A8J3IVQ0_9CHLR|nr:MFS transporter [Reticulibacter mediterranei]GHO98719.1 MFS transporter [Reticulibacter mediterranei]
MPDEQKGMLPPVKYWEFLPTLNAVFREEAGRIVGWKSLPEESEKPMKRASVQENRFEQQELRATWGAWVALVIVSMAVFLDAVDVSIVNVALPAIKLDLQLTTIELQWVPGAYILTYGGFMLLGGRAADLFGRRRIFLLGAALFGFASLVGGLAHGGWVLILARGGQGIGAALTMPAAISIITTTFPEGKARNQALGIFIATGGAGFAGGLILGGIFTTFISWHWVFFVNVPVSLLILLLSPVVIHEGKQQTGTRSYDLGGALTVTAGLLLLVYAMTQANEEGSTPLKTTGLFALALAFLVVFLLIEWRSKAPLLPLRLFRSRTLGAACIVSFTMGSYFSFLFIYTLYLQNVLHVSPLDTSLTLLPAAIAAIPVSQFVAPWFMNRLGMKLTAGLGMLGLVSGIVLFLRAGETFDYVGLILPATLLTMPCGMALCLPTLPAAATSSVKQTEQGLASGLQGTLGQAGAGFFLALAATVVTAWTPSVHRVGGPSALSVTAQLSGLHAGILVIAAGAALGAIVAIVGIRSQPVITLDAPDEEHGSIPGLLETCEEECGSQSVCTQES